MDKFADDIMKIFDNDASFEILNEKIEFIISEDLTMAFDREYANGFYRPDWDETIEDFEKYLKDNNLVYHMPNPYTVMVEKK